VPRSIVGAIPAWIAVALVCLTACGDDGAASTNGSTEPEAEPADAAPAVVGDPADAAPPVTYAESKKALGELIDELLAALADDDRARANRLVESFELMDYQGWFTQHFGDALGSELAASYEPAVGRFDQLLGVLDELVDKGHDQVVIERFTSLTDKDAVMYQNLALRAMKKRAALYSVRLIDPKAAAEDPDRVFHLWSFVHHDGSFRWVGKLKEVAPQGEEAADLIDDEGRDRRELRLRELEKIDALTGP
jgi:hypothetical protein